MNAEEAQVGQGPTEAVGSGAVESSQTSNRLVSEASSTSKRVLEPIERISEVLFGLITYVFNLGWPDPNVVLSVGFTF